ncbi:hypothetical protein MKW94_008654 [Papaver nudicaule]|uniref:SKP1-like protein n=1 Tax=Papaver nudicaule TaxID=74823 RepID=A0AA41SHC9_PAPNU|nr:hypothetical protein [Papaver nudicaule]
MASSAEDSKLVNQQTYAPETTTEAAAASSTTTEAAASSSTTTEVAASKKIIILRSSDNETFEVEESAALLSETVKHMIEDDCAENGIPLPNVSGKILGLVSEFLVAHGEKKGDELTNWQKEYIKGMDRNTLFDVILAANYLSIKDLLDITCQAVADYIKDMKVEDVRKEFNIENDFSPEEEKALREENAWAFQE